MVRHLLILALCLLALTPRVCTCPHAGHHEETPTGESADGDEHAPHDHDSPCPDHDDSCPAVSEAPTATPSNCESAALPDWPTRTFCSLAAQQASRRQPPPADPPPTSTPVYLRCCSLRC
jgi:hypothetical protein